MLVNDARNAMKDEQAPVERLRSLSAELQQVYHGLGTTTEQPQGAGPAPSGPAQAAGDDVIDAEFTAPE
jgi:molecular chaperone DnaK